jgi:hypothetical protein
VRSTPRPVLPPGIPQHFLPVRGAAPAGSALVYVPVVVGAATVRFADTKAGVDAQEELVCQTPVTAEAVPVRWDQAHVVEVSPDELESTPREPAEFAELPPAGARAKSYEGWKRDFAAWLTGSRTLELFRHPESRTLSRPGESERDFRVRLDEATREARDRQKEVLRQKYGARIAAVEERLRRAQQAVAREKEQVTQAGLQAVISAGATILGAFLGRKAVSVSSVGRATTAARGAGRVLKEQQDIGRAKETVEAVQQERERIEAEFQADAAAMEARSNPLADRLEPVVVKPKKAGITVQLVGLGWAPHWRDARGGITPASA